ncbi:MAG TPA: MFS transporter [Mycobacterium sp.]|nr:MFS transporter [Mycobacterium sp.]
MIARGGRYAAVLRVHDLRLLVIAFLTDGAATWSYTVVLVGYVFERTHSAGWVTAFVSARYVTGMLFGSYGGVLADRYDRRKVLMGSAVAATLTTLVLAVLVASNASLVALWAAAMVLNAVCTPVRPASGALIPEVVSESQLLPANIIFGFLESVIIVIGPAVGGLLLLTGTPAYGVLTNTASYVVSLLLYARVTVSSRGSAQTGGNFVKQWANGVAVLGEHRKALVLTGFLVLDGAAFAGANVLLPALSAHLHGGTTGYSLMLGANAFGGVVAGGLANRLAGSPRLAAVIMGSIVLECVPLWVCAYAHIVVNAVVLQVASGVGMVIVDVLALTALQRDLPREVLGRVLSAVDVLWLGSSLGTAIATSSLYSHLGLAWALALVGIAFPALGLLGLPALRAVDRAVADKLARLLPHVALLEQLDLFSGAPRSLLESLAGAAQPETVAAGTVIIRQGDTSDTLWILAHGQLSVSAQVADGAIRDLPSVEAPGYVGELGLLHHSPRSATVVAATACELLRIPGEDFVAALEDAKPSPSMISRAEVRMARTLQPAAAG